VGAEVQVGRDIRGVVLVQVVDILYVHLSSLYDPRELMFRATLELSHHYHILPQTHLLVFEMMIQEEQRGEVQYHLNHPHTDLSP
jgi:hypothetical protein